MLKKTFILIFFYNSFQVFQYVQDKYSYQYEDWLINYSNGFVRRGLIGEILIKVSSIINFNLQYLVLFFLIFLLAIFYKKSYNLISKIEYGKIYYFLIFSPFFFFFYLVNHSAGIRKEFLLYIFFIYLITDEKIDISKYKLYFYSLVFSILILVHEGLIFYLPFYFLFIIFKSNKKNLKTTFFNMGLVVCCSLLFALLSIKFNGSDEHVVKICESLTYNVKESCATGGAINHLKDGLSYSINHVFKEHDSLSIFNWILITLFGFFPLIIIIKNSEFKKNYFVNYYLHLKTKYFYIIFLTLSLISILPLFIVAFDWGRWLSIYYHLAAFNLLYLIKSKKIRLNEKIFFELFFKKKLLYKNIFFILILYSTFVTPSVFDKKSDEDLNPYKFNYLNMSKKIIDKNFN